MAAKKLAHSKTFTISKLYSKYSEIKEYHIYNLLEFLYKDKDEWLNPLTKKFIHRNSDIIISFLSKGYYIYGDLEIIINGDKLPYKEHIKRFIDKGLLIDVRHLKRSPTAPPKRASSNSPPGAGINLPKSKSPPKTGIPGITGITGIPPVHPPAVPPNNTSPKSPMGAATNKPKTPPQPVPATPQAVAALAVANSKKPIRFNSKSTKGKHDKNSESLNEALCIRFVKHIKDTLQKTKTSAELKGLKFTNPVTGNLIGIESPILRSFLSKCYYSFNKNKEIKEVIEEIANVSDLIEEEKIVTNTPVIDAKTLKINEAIDDALKAFHKCCDEIQANCDANGILEKHSFITNVVNSIMTIIHIRYMHLNNLYNKFDVKDKKPLQIYMHDETFRRHIEELANVPKALFIRYYNGNNIVYQRNDLQINNAVLDINPKTIDTYYLNNLFNRQYVFEYPFDANTKVFKETLKYNMVNIRYFGHPAYPKSIEEAKAAFDSKTGDRPYFPFNYNITNSSLPKYIFTNDDNMISTYFKDIIDMVNVRLQTLPVINGIEKEYTQKNSYYESIIKGMKMASFGDNETEYGKKNMIRKNILYSLNAQSATYILKKYPAAYNDLYYNSEFSGTFPLFTWIPLNRHNHKSIYNYPNFFQWQPLGLDIALQKDIERAYKNNGVPPWSKHLNDTIYKTITNIYSSVNTLFTDQQSKDDMRERVKNTIGIYKDNSRNPKYNNNKIYLYHGTRNKLHDIGRKWDEDIEILGFLSTSLNMYTASVYSGVGTMNNGFIYIIEVDYTQTYINLNDDLKQFLLLPYSRIRVVLEFNYGDICVVLCRLFRTPTIETNNKLYNKLLDIYKQPNSADINKYVNYRIKANNNEMPVCAFMLSKFWRANVEYGNEDMEVYRIGRNKLNNNRINNTSFPSSKLKEEYIYFSLGQEYQLYVERGLPLNLGSFEDIKYSVHQHFIKDCYKALGIPCIDYIFIHSPFINNAITTGILLEDYKNNIIDHYKYDVNNLLIDCIFKFNSINKDNRQLNIIDGREIVKGIYVDKIEGFRDAGLYCSGVINPLFNKDAEIGEHIQYISNWKHLFTKYQDASDEDLKKHFSWCNNRIVKLIEIIKTTKEHYLKFINETLIGKLKDTSIDKKGVLEKASKEALELNAMIEALSSTLLKRAVFYKKSTSDVVIKLFIDMIRVILSDGHINIHNSKLYKNPVLADLILEEKRKSDTLTGGILSMKDIMKINTQAPQRSPSNSKEGASIDHQKLYEMFKNVPIQESKDMRKYADMPKSFQEYYKGAILDKDGCFDISDHCYCRPVKKV